MRIANCTHLRIPIIICSRANSSSFALCGMRQLCADAEDVALVWQNEHRHAIKTTESGHERSSTHGGKENLVAPSWFVSEIWFSKKNKKTFFFRKILLCTSKTDPLFFSFSHFFSNLYPSTQKKNTTLLVSRGDRRSRTHTGEMSLRHILRGWWQTFSWSTTRYEEEDVQHSLWERVQGRGVTHTSRCLSVVTTAPQDRDLSLIMGSFHTYLWHSFLKKTKKQIPLSSFFFFLFPPNK